MLRSVDAFVVVEAAEARRTLRDVVASAWVSSWLGRARPGDLADADPTGRAAAWAQWALSSLGTFTGAAERSYPALILPGRFYDPRGTAPKARPHLELSRTVLDRVDAFAPERFAQAGAGLLFGWWLVDEVTAARRAVFSTPSGSVEQAAALLSSHRSGLVEATASLASALAPAWPAVEALLVADPDALVDAVCGDVAASEVARLLPAASASGMHAVFDTKLRDRNGSWATRRVGVWQLRGVDDAGEPFALGVVTPRLTRNSLFSDPLFDPAAESAGALLLRALVLARVASVVGVGGVSGPIGADRLAGPVKAGPHLRAVVAQPGQAMPRPSTAGAVHFLATFPVAADAWAALCAWADAGEYLLTVTRDGFAAAHAAASRCLRRAEEPDRADVEVLLPLAWDAKNRVVRVTFSKPVAEDD